MSSIVYRDPELVIALNTKIIFVNPNDLQIFKEVELPHDLTKCGLQLVKRDGEIDHDESGSKQQEELVPHIQHVQLSPTREFLAVTTSGQKALLLYFCYPVHAKLVSVRPLSRASSGLAFSSDSKKILVTDKTGDCYEYDCVNYKAVPRLLLGHLSIVYDVIWTPDAKHIITCDRDDKIRVTNYPDTHDIHGYCLGHKEFVAGMALLKDEVLSSVSGDKTLRLWDYQKGEQLTDMQLPAPGIRLAVRENGEHKWQAAVLLHQPEESVGLYDIVTNSEGNWQISESSLFTFPGVVTINLCFANERLYVAGIIDDHFTLKMAPIANVPEPPENWLQMVDEQFREEVWKPDDLSAWFKKRYDNVSDYLERKKRRIEEKQK